MTERALLDANLAVVAVRGLVRHQRDGPIGLHDGGASHGSFLDDVPSLEIRHEPRLQLPREELRGGELRLGDGDVRVVQHAVADIHGEGDCGCVVFPERLVVVHVLEVSHALLRVGIGDDVLLEEPPLPDVLEELRDVHLHVQPRDVVYDAALLRPREFHPVQHERRDDRPHQHGDPKPNSRRVVDDQRVRHRELHPTVPHHGPLADGPVQRGEGQRAGDEHLHHVAGRGRVVQLHLLSRGVVQLFRLLVHLRSNGRHDD